MTVRHPFQMLKLSALSAAILVGIAVQCSTAEAQSDAQDTATAIVAGGCFWCVEADFEKVDGVTEVVSGYTGGDVENPTYRQVVGGGTGHREAVEIRYDPDVVSYERLIELFLRSIDPLDDGGQFCDRGFSYTAAIHPQTEREAEIARAEIAEAEEELGREVRVPVEMAEPFYEAEEYHQDYYKKDDLILTRFGPQPKSRAYDLYRKGCNRDQRVRAVWGEDAPFAGG